jgi:DNA-binding beta-propeller fold protein YncE
MRRLAISALAALAAAAAVAVNQSQAPAATSKCSTATASGPGLASADPTFTHLGGEPFGVATTRGYAFVANLSSGLDVLADRDSAPHLIHKIALPRGQGVGITLTANGRYLLIADGGDGADVVDVARAEAGATDAVLGTLSAGSTNRLGGGAIEVATSRDGRYAFVSLEDAREIAVYSLASAIADHFKKPAYVGAIPTGIAPVGLAVSPDGRWLYSTSEIGAPGGGGNGQIGSLSAISIAAAERGPTHAVVATVSAGCNPVRVAVSADGGVVWVTARASDELLAFSTSKLEHHTGAPQVASVRVGEAPVGLALVDHGAEVVVADSNRFSAGGATSGLTFVSTAKALAHHPAIVGTVRSGLFPREMALEPAGTVLLVGNFESGTLESVQITAHAQESGT